MDKPDQPSVSATAHEAAPPVLLLVDDETNILSALRRLFHPHGYHIRTASSGAEALALLEQEPVDLVISDMRMPQMDGVQLLEQVRKKWPDTIRILLTGYADIDSTVAAINRGEIYRYIAKPWNDNDIVLVVRQALNQKALEQEKRRLEQLTQRQNEELKALNASLESKVEERTAELRKERNRVVVANEKLKSGFIVSVKVFSSLVEQGEKHRPGHSRRVAGLAQSIARKLGLDHGMCQDIMVAGLLHDVGKIGMPDAVWDKPVSEMNAGELAQYKKHPVKGERVLMAVEELRSSSRLLRSHHERFDGLGFPDGLRAQEIPLGARILAVANDYDALQIGTYEPRFFLKEEARDFIVSWRGKRYDPDVADVFISIIESGPFEWRQEDLLVRELALGPEQLEPGMILTRDLVSRDGLLMLAEKHVLDKDLIVFIREFAKDEGGGVMIHIDADKIRP